MYAGVNMIDLLNTQFQKSYIEYYENHSHGDNQDERCCPKKYSCVARLAIVGKITKTECGIDKCQLTCSMHTRKIVLTWQSLHRVITYSHF